MKHYLPFFIMIVVGICVCLWQFLFPHNCLFTFQNRCYTCDEKDVFFVGLPENCTVCPNRHIQYIDWKGKGIWACLHNSISEDEEIEFHEDFSNTTCPSKMPLQDILGHCYTCQTDEPVQISGKNTCQGKRYLTNYRNSNKSNRCPSLGQIQDPYVCISCHGYWLNEKCTPFSLKPMNFCKKNSDCSDGQWCHPFHYPLYSKSGICRPLIKKKLVCSDIEGYSYEAAQIFCSRQNMRLASLTELEKNKDMVLSSCPKTNIWVVFDEGSIYLDSLKKSFPITKEKESFESVGDNSYALCIQN